jgi:hypothetical protein
VNKVNSYGFMQNINKEIGQNNHTQKKKEEKKKRKRKSNTFTTFGLRL